MCQGYSQSEVVRGLQLEGRRWLRHLIPPSAWPQYVERHAALRAMAWAGLCSMADTACKQLQQQQAEAKQPAGAATAEHAPAVLHAGLSDSAADAASGWMRRHEALQQVRHRWGGHVWSRYVKLIPRTPTTGFRGYISQWQIITDEQDQQTAAAQADAAAKAALKGSSSTAKLGSTVFSGFF